MLTIASPRAAQLGGPISQRSSHVCNKITRGGSSRRHAARGGGLRKPGDDIVFVSNSHLAIENLTLQTPNHARTLVADLSLSIDPGQG